MQRDSVSLCVIPSHIGVAPHGAYIWTWSDRRSLRGVHEARVEHARHGDLPAGVMGMKATAGARRVRRDRTRIVKRRGCRYRGHIQSGASVKGALLLRGPGPPAPGKTRRPKTGREGRALRNFPYSEGACEEYEACNA